MELIRIAASTNKVVGTYPFSRILGVYLSSGIDASSISLFDDVVQTGTEKVLLKANAVVSNSFRFEEPGIPFKTGVAATLTGTTPVAYILVA